MVPPAGAATAVESLPRPSYADPDIPAGYYALDQQLQRFQAERLTRQREQWEREREAREALILDAAERLLEEHGYLGLNMDLIAEGNIGKLIIGPENIGTRSSAAGFL